MYIELYRRESDSCKSLVTSIQDHARNYDLCDRIVIPTYCDKQSTLQSTSYNVTKIIIGRGELNNLDICYSLSSSGFSLRGDSSGGPPEIYTWSRDGTVINDADSFFSISIALNGNSLQTNTESRYRSTLTVAENLTGVYQYSISNRATPTTLTRTINTSNVVIARY